MADTHARLCREWAETTSPAFLLHLLAVAGLGTAIGGRRKLRLLGCAAARSVWEHLPDDRYRAVVEAAEAHADRSLPRAEMLTTHSQLAPAQLHFFDAIGRGFEAVLSLFGLAGHEYERTQAAVAIVRPVAGRSVGHAGIMQCLLQAVRLAGLVAEHAHADARRADTIARHVQSIRDLFGHPFEPWHVEPQWRTSAVVGLCRAIHKESAFEQMPILADALEEAGCVDDGVLRHCREEPLHARGCWVIDGLLGRMAKLNANPPPYWHSAYGLPEMTEPVVR